MTKITNCTKKYLMLKLNVKKGVSDFFDQMSAFIF